MLNAHPTGELTEPNARQRFEPRDRESFFAAQARNRRATWRISVLCVLAAALMGIPLALIITPLLYGVALIIADVVNLFSPLPLSSGDRQVKSRALGGSLSIGYCNREPLIRRRSQ